MQQPAFDPTPSPPPSGRARETAGLQSSLFEVFPPSGRHKASLKAARALCEALFTADDRNPPAADRMEWIQGEVDHLLCQVGWRPGGIYKVLLLSLALLAPLWIGRPMPLWRLPLPARVRALRKMERSFAASLVLGTKAIICMIYYEHPEVARETGLTLGCLGESS